ncbi:arsenate reductase/protein-tyrosine-phosphatase family protein [Senegalia sp. (in: firmicutes)]|uniref:low molecular weight protein arginine phosphatase n=1 Tax=Senegalia sp. (in: firmicutes) TaxID=1924098 RepID=UPI003F9D89B9
MKNILFVCTGNTCRSSMAEAMLKDMMKDKDVFIYSRGVSAIENMSASKHAIRVMENMGIDMTNHKSKLLTKKDVDKADIILTMTLNHKSLVVNLYPHAKGKIYTLKEYANRDVDINAILDEINDIYKEINKKRDHLMKERQGEVARLQERKRNLLKEVEKIEDELIEWRRDIEAELEDEKAKIINLQRKIPELDVEDPFGGPTSQYRESAEEIKSALEKIIDELDN